MAKQTITFDGVAQQHGLTPLLNSATLCTYSRMINGDKGIFLKVFLGGPTPSCWVTGNPRLDSDKYPGGREYANPAQLSSYLTDYFGPPYGKAKSPTKASAKTQ